MYAGGVAVVARSRNSARERAHRAPPRSRVLFRALPPGAPLKEQKTTHAIETHAQKAAKICRLSRFSPGDCETSKSQPFETMLVSIHIATMGLLLPSPSTPPTNILQPGATLTGPVQVMSRCAALAPALGVHRTPRSRSA